jgi:hypothetical protein
MSDIKGLSVILADITVCKWLILLRMLCMLLFLTR